MQRLQRKNERRKHRCILTARASETLSRCFVRFETAVAIFFFVTYIRSENDKPYKYNERKR